MAVPLFIKSPFDVTRRGEITNFQASLLDVVPTVLDWFSIDYPRYHILKPSEPTTLTGRSLLPLLRSEDVEQVDTFFGSHVTHEVTMNYPMRTIIREGRFKLIHNLNAPIPFPIDQDFYLSPTFLVFVVNVFSCFEQVYVYIEELISQDMLNRTLNGRPLRWIKELSDYYFREEWEMFDLKKDPQESVNLRHKKKYRVCIALK